MRTINTVPIPRVDFDGGHVDNINLDLFVEHNDSISLAFSEAANGGILTTKDVNGMVSCSVKYKMLFITINADAKITFDQGAITMKATLPLHTQVVNQRHLLRVNVSDFDLQFDTSKIHINLTGSVLADVLDKIIFLFKNVVLKAISGVIDSEVPPALQSAINDEIIATNGFAPIYDNIALDVQIPADPIVTNDAIQLYVNGTIFDEKLGYKVPGTAIANL